MRKSIPPEEYFRRLNDLLNLYFPTLEETERWLFWSALCRKDFVHKDAAVLLGITPRIFCYHLKKNKQYWQELLEEDLDKCELL